MMKATYICDRCGKEVPNMTIEEIEEKLGYRVRIVKGEDKHD